MPEGVVKFFNGGKGFGFISPEDGGPDVFVHVSALHDSGLDELGEGDQVSFELERDRRSGKQAAVSLRVIGRGAAPAGRPRGGGGRGFDRPSGGSRGGEPVAVGSGTGVVKWFSPTKGFGFIQPNAGGADIFVHVSAVTQAGLNGLADGQPVSFDLAEDRRSGKLSAVNLRLD